MRREQLPVQPTHVVFAERRTLERRTHQFGHHLSVLHDLRVFLVELLHIRGEPPNVPVDRIQTPVIAILEALYDRRQI